MDIRSGVGDGSHFVPSVKSFFKPSVESEVA